MRALCINPMDVQQDKRSNDLKKDLQLYVLQLGRKDPDSAESLAIRLILELMWIHRLRSTTPLGLNVLKLRK